MGYDRCYAEISVGALNHNLAEIKKRVAPGVKILAVVKANAYGHGAERVACEYADKVDFFAVATAEEGIQLRDCGIKNPILILGYTSPSQYEEIICHQIRPAVYSLEDAEKFQAAAEKLGVKAPLHIALDTGMTRIGFDILEESADRIARIAAMPNVILEGMFSHFSCCDQQDKEYCKFQLKNFTDMIGMLEKRGVNVPIRHICNSAGIMEFDDYRFDMVRAGIIIYGIYPSEDVQKERLDLRPVLSWKAHVIRVHEVGPGVSVSYGAAYTTSRPTTIATVSVGYADGYPRALSSKGRVLIHGKSAPIIGRVCMDQMMVDITNISDVKVEDTVTLVGWDGDEHISIEEIADPCARFNYEMLCDISPRVKRVYVD
ncbi:MAG: alanine racemase [Eubacterium sp.]|nr:alanine racemase [Eubacterium sp.]